MYRLYWSQQRTHHQNSPWSTCGHLPQQYLFNWQHVDVASDLDRLRPVLTAIPHEKLMP
ncbi:MAG: hypothetical protein HY815_25720 [Candidatus Riflebacteria bacterium]|nr:hypothetical protein [Candidatus Riflebacteria bacterium]